MIFTNKKIMEKNKVAIEKLREKNKQLEIAMSIKPTTAGKIWFYITCLRPVTKIELAHTAQAIVQNRRLLNQMIVQMNTLTLKVSEIIGYLQGQKGTLSKDINDNMAKNLKKILNKNKDKDNIMYR